MSLPRGIEMRMAFLALALPLAACDGGSPSGSETHAAPGALRVQGGDGQQGVVGGELPQDLAVEVIDAGGRPVRDVRVYFAVVNGGGQVAPAQAISDAQGLARTRWTLGTVAADSQVVEARVRSVTPVRVRAQARADAASDLAPVAGNGAAGPVGGVLVDSLAVTVRDRLGNPVAGVEVVWDAVSGGGSLSPTRGVTGAGGVARAQWTLGPRVDSAQTAVAQVAGLYSVAFTANAVTAGVPLQLAKRGGDGQRGPAGGVLADSLGVVLRMQDGRPVRGAVVTWSVPAAAGSVTPAVSRTDANGAASAVWRLGTSPGLVRATATVDEGTLSFTALTGAAAPAQIVAVSGGGEGLVGGVLADSLAVRVTDAFGNPVPGAEVAWSALTGGGSVQPERSATDAQGYARSRWTLGFLAGTPGQTLSASVGGLAPVTFRATGVTAGVPLQLARAGGDGQTAEVGRDLQQPLVVQLRTPAGVPVEGATVVWAVTGGGGRISPATSRTDAEGRARATWTMGPSVGAASASARVDEGALAFSAVARAGAPASVQVAGGNWQHATRGIPLDDSIVARVEDAYGNPVAGVPVQWSVLGGEGHLEHATSVTGADGTARTRWAMGFTPGENTAAAVVDGLSAARFTATGVAGTLTFRVEWVERVRSEYRSEYLINYVRFTAHVTDLRGNRAIGAPITWSWGAELKPPTHWDSESTATMSAAFDLIGDVWEQYAGWVQFEDQNQELTIIR